MARSGECSPPSRRRATSNDDGEDENEEDEERRQKLKRRREERGGGGFDDRGPPPPADGTEGGGARVDRKGGEGAKPPPRKRQAVEEIEGIEGIDFGDGALLGLTLDGEARTKAVGVAAGWGLLNLLAAAGLLAQYAAYNFDELARQDRYRPWFEQLCPNIGCELPSSEIKRQLFQMQQATFPSLKTQDFHLVKETLAAIRLQQAWRRRQRINAGLLLGGLPRGLRSGALYRRHDIRRLLARHLQSPRRIQARLHRGRTRACRELGRFR